MYLSLSLSLSLSISSLPLSPSLLAESSDVFQIGCELGDKVGYSIRFEDVTSERTLIKFVVLLRRCPIVSDRF